MLQDLVDGTEEEGVGGWGKELDRGISAAGRSGREEWRERE